MLWTLVDKIPAKMTKTENFQGRVVPFSVYTASSMQVHATLSAKAEHSAAMSVGEHTAAAFC